MPPSPLPARAVTILRKRITLLLRRDEVGAGPGGQRLGSATLLQPAAIARQMLIGLIKNPGTRSFSGHLCFGSDIPQRAPILKSLALL